MTLKHFGLYDPLLTKEELGKVKRMTEEKKKSNIDYNVSTPVDLGKDKTFWLRIGSAWKKGDNISISLNALPLTGKLFLAKPKED